MALRKRNIILSIAILSSLSLTCGYSQTPRVKTTTFRALQLGAKPITDLHITNDAGQLEHITAFSRINKSPAYTYQGPNPIVFFKPEFDAQTETIMPAPLVSVHIPSGCTKPLIFFKLIAEEGSQYTSSPETLDIPKQSPRYTTYIVDESIQHFPNESVIVLNTTDDTLLGKLGGKSIACAPGPSAPIDISQHIPSATKVQLAIEGKVKPRVVFTNHIHFYNNQRTILVIAPPRRPGSRQVLVYTVAEGAE